MKRVRIRVQLSLSPGLARWIKSEASFSDLSLSQFVKMELVKARANSSPSGWTPPKSLPPATALYFIRNCRSGAIKIGVSTDPKRRVSGLQVANQDRLELLGWVDGWGYVEESKLHRRFSHLKLRGEWFEPDPGLIRLVAGNCRRAARRRATGAA